MSRKESTNGKAKKKSQPRSSCSAVEGILEKRIEDIVNFLGSAENSKSRLYDDILATVERCLIRIALKRSNNIKTSAAGFLGINRNTLHKKMEQHDISCQE
jgi:DNA-binding protein Fis